MDDKHASAAIGRLPDFKMKKIDDLDAEEKTILALVKINSGMTTTDLFQIYQKKGGEKSFRTFQRKVKDLVEGKFIAAKELNKGADEGRSTILEFGTTLKDFQ